MKRFDVLGCGISVTTFKGAIEAINERVKEGTGGYVCFSNVHTVVSSMKDAKLRAATNQAFMAMPDGKPLSLVGKIRDGLPVEQVSGPDFMFKFIESMGNASHYFYGSSPETLDKLIRNIEQRYPNTVIAGTFSPPYRKLTKNEQLEHIDTINKSGADIVWVGLGAPKQESWMMDNWEKLVPAILLGVGAAFDFHAGVKKRSPVWMSKCGLEWLFRLCCEPSRLWKRYFVTNTVFLLYVFRQLVRKNPGS